MEDLPKLTDGVAHVLIKRSQLKLYLEHLRQHYDIVPLTPIRDTTESATMVTRSSQEVMFLLEVNEEE